MAYLERWRREFRASHPSHTCVDRPHIYCEACKATLLSAPPVKVSAPAPTNSTFVAPPCTSPEDSVEFLTKLQTGRAFLPELQDALKEAKSVTLIQADLDKFHALNLAHGHEVGDELLRAIGDIFLRSCRPLGNRCIGPCRFGGESFMFALIDMDEAVAGLAEGIREWIASLQPSVTARFVVVTGVSNLGDLLNVAHDVLYPHPDLKVPNSVTFRSRRSDGF